MQNTVESSAEESNRTESNTTESSAEESDAALSCELATLKKSNGIKVFVKAKGFVFGLSYRHTYSTKLNF